MSPDPTKPQAPQTPPIQYRKFGDHGAVRDALYSNSLAAVEALPPAENSRFKLSLNNVGYASAPNFTPLDHKDALLNNRTLARRLAGTFTVTDKATGATVDKRRMTIASIPHLLDQGVFILDGTQMPVSAQLRLDPGIFARRKASGELESHVSFLPGKGIPHRVILDPETGVFRTLLGQSEIPVLPLMRILGVTDDALKEAWGEKLFHVNQKATKPQHFDKYWEKFGPRNAPEDADKRKILAERLTQFELDPWVTKRTLGKPYATYGGEPLLAATKKLLDISHGRAEPDDRDNPAFSSVWGPEHLLPERLTRSGPQLAKALWAVTNASGSLKRLTPGLLTPSVRALFTKSGLSGSVEGASALEFVDHGARITKVGEGGIGRSADAVPDSARDVSPGQFPFIDPIRTSESESVGLDLRVAFGTRLGSDKRIYAPLRDARTNKLVYKNPRDLADSVVAFPGVMNYPDQVVPVIKGGNLTYADKKDVDFVAPSMEQSFSPLTNMVPLKSASKGHRASMGGRMISQALELDKPESPLVRTEVPNQPGKSFEELYGRHVGAIFADKPGTVTEVTPTSVTVTHADGTQRTELLHRHLPSGRKTGFNQTAVVKPGDLVAPGQLLVRSGMTDEKGHAAYGANLRTAFMVGRGNPYEDSMVLSRSAADKLTSRHVYKHTVATDEHTLVGKAAHSAAFGGKHSVDVLKNVGDDGVVKPGTVVNYGDPLVLAVRKKPGVFGRLSRSAKSGLSDASEVWEHHEPGTVVDAVNATGGPVVTVATAKPFQDGDKLCYDAETEVLTTSGWKKVTDVTVSDAVASLNPTTNAIEYLTPDAVHTYPYNGRMYTIRSTQVDLMVTDTHHLYAAPRSNKGDVYDLHEARELFGRRYKLKRDGVWVGVSPKTITLPGVTVKAGQFGRGTRELPPLELEAKTYAMLLGMFLSEGHLVREHSSGTYGIALTQIKPASRQRMLEALTAAGIEWTPANKNTQVKIYGVRLYEHFRQFGEGASEKFIPENVFNWDQDLLEVLFAWLAWGDGSVEDGKIKVYHTTSPKLADDVQRLALHTGRSANIKRFEGKWGEIKGKTYWHKPRYWVSIYNSKNRPEINHGHAKKQKAFSEVWTSHTGDVYCVTLPRNHVLYVRRNGKPVWCGNSGRHGNKGVAVVKPDHEMPIGEDGRPVEMILSSLGTISRVNPSAAAFEALLGKIAEKRGQPYVVKDFDDEGSGHSVNKWVQSEAAKHGVNLFENLTDPKTGRKIPNVALGNIYTMKLLHIAEGKAKGRGLGGYDETGQPLRGQAGKALRASLGDTNALLSHGATSVLYDLHINKGAENPEFWAAYMQGYPPPKPNTSPAFDRFLTELRAGGVDPIRKDGRYHLMALTDKRIKELAGDREIANGETLDFSKDGQPYPGGLFDSRIWGTTDDASTWGKITLHEPIVNPAFENPTRRLLGLTEKSFRNIISGQETLNGKTGNEAIVAALKTIDVEKELAQTRKQVQSTRKTARDEANKKLPYLKGLQKTGLTPADWIMSAVPVLPPAYRPVRPGGPRGEVIVSDPNVLYGETIGANQALRDLSKVTTETGAERLNLYDSVKAVVGLGDPVGSKSRERGVRGILDRLFGDSSKSSFLQQKLLGTPTNLSGRGQVLPNPDLDLDQIGLPLSVARDIYHPFVVRRLIRQGLGRADSARAVEDWSPEAKEALNEEMRVRPVLATRYPALHRFSVQGFRPVLMHGDAIQTNHLINKGFNLDHDGNCLDYHEIIQLLLSESTLKATTRGAEFLASVKEVAMRLVSDEQVSMLESDNRVVRIKIGDFPRAEKSTLSKEGQDIYLVPEGVSVLTYDHNTGNVQYSAVTTFTHELDHEIVKVTTTSGKEVTVSNNASMCVFDPDTGDVKQSEPKVGDFVPCIKSEPVLGTQYDYDIGWWYGMMISDGWVSGNTVGLAKADPAKRERFVEIARKKICDNFTARTYIREKPEEGDLGPNAKVHLNGQDLVGKVFDCLVCAPPPGERAALYKKIPDELLIGGSRECLLGLLAGMLDGDGTVTWNHALKNRRFVVRCNTSSIYLLPGLKVLCRKLGLRFSLTVTAPRGISKHTAYSVCPSIVDFHDIASKLILVDNVKHAVIQDFARGPKADVDRLDLIPVSPDLVVDLCKLFPSTKGSVTRVTYYVAYQARSTGYYTRGQAETLLAALPPEYAHPKLDSFRRMVRNVDVLWERIETVEPAGRVPVYDLGVPDTKVFMVGSGIIVWDTMTVQLPLSDEAVKETYEKLLPSKNLYSPQTLKATSYIPGMEYLQGLHYASTADQGNEPLVFHTRKEALRAFAENPEQFTHGTRVRILEDEQKPEA